MRFPAARPPTRCGSAKSGVIPTIVSRFGTDCVGWLFRAEVLLEGIWGTPFVPQNRLINVPPSCELGAPKRVTPTPVSAASQKSVRCSRTRLHGARSSRIQVSSRRPHSRPRRPALSGGATAPPTRHLQSLLPPLPIRPQPFQERVKRRVASERCEALVVREPRIGRIALIRGPRQPSYRLVLPA